MKKGIIMLVVVLFFSCKKEDQKSAREKLSGIKESPEVVAKEGNGKIILNCNGKEIIAEGICGAIVTMGQLVVTVQDKVNPAKIFTISFNGEAYPENGIPYKIKEKDYSQDEAGPKDEIEVDFAEALANSKMNSWGSSNANGQLQFEVNGSEVKCAFKGLKLSANKMLNGENLQGEAVVSGTFTFYKNQ